MDKEIGDESAQVAGVEQELQGFEDGILGYFDEAMGSVEDIEAIEMQGSAESELARDKDVREPKNMPVPDEHLPTAIEDVPGVLGNVPAAPEIALESDENELAVSKDIPAVYNSSPECQASFVHHGKLPAFEDKQAAVKDILASDDTLATDNGIPAEYNNFPEHESIPMSCKIPPADKRVVCKTLRIPRDLLKLQIGYRLPLTGFYGPVSPIFTYTKVRKKVYFRGTTTHLHTEAFRHFFEHPLSMLPCFRSVHPLRNLYGFQLLSEILHSIRLFQVQIWEVVESALAWDGSGLGCFCADYWALVEDVPWSHVKPPVSTGNCRQAFVNDGLVMQDLLIGRLTKTAIFFEVEGEGLATKQRKRKPSPLRTEETPYHQKHSLQIIVEKPYDDRLISPTTRGIRNEMEKKALLEAYRCPADHICLEAPEELPKIRHSCYKSKYYDQPSNNRFSTDHLQVFRCYKTRNCSQYPTPWPTRHDGNLIVCTGRRQRLRRFGTWRSMISKHGTRVPDFQITVRPRGAVTCN